jgi:hypothetical protein
MDFNNSAMQQLSDLHCKQSGGKSSSIFKSRSTEIAGLVGKTQKIA